MYAHEQVTIKYLHLECFFMAEHTQTCLVRKRQSALLVSSGWQKQEMVTRVYEHTHAHRGKP